MSRLRKFIGLWLTLLEFGIVFPVTFYLMSRLLDTVFDLSPFINPQTGALIAAFLLFIGIFWVSWGYSYIHFEGRGTPIEAFGKALYPTSKLVTTGPYAYVRNPMLLGQMFILLAIAFYTGSLSGLILIPILTLIALAYIRMYEEPELVRRFGDKYVQYRKSVPAIIPRLKRPA